jgi:hypothetical protein
MRSDAESWETDDGENEVSEKLGRSHACLGGYRVWDPLLIIWIPGKQNQIYALAADP